MKFRDSQPGVQKPHCLNRDSIIFLIGIYIGVYLSEDMLSLHVKKIFFVV
ncbi:hypothetical protein [Bacillus sp. FSL L8-0152]